MEWLKLRTLRSNCRRPRPGDTRGDRREHRGWGAHHSVTGDLTNNYLAGIAIGLLITGVLGTLVMSSEYTTGLGAQHVRRCPEPAHGACREGELSSARRLWSWASSRRSSPSSRGGRRPPAAASSGRDRRSVGDPGDPARRRRLRAHRHLGLGIGALVRHTPAAIGVLVGGVYVAAQALGGVLPAMRAYVPIAIVADSLTTVHKPAYALPAALGSARARRLRRPRARGGWMAARPPRRLTRPSELASEPPRSRRASP